MRFGTALVRMEPAQLEDEERGDGKQEAGSR
jgi:hypothetical protein